MPDELKPCPFCGEELGAPPIGHRGGSRCAICGCSASGPVQVTEPEAVRAWQGRPLEDKLAARIGELEGEIRVLEQRVAIAETKAKGDGSGS